MILDLIKRQLKITVYKKLKLTNDNYTTPMYIEILIARAIK